ncbi:hypothetical protein LLD17_09560 [Lactococcus cremoris]|uniref:Uncharacterized protein n=2 Tax=Lactococcus lactis subsp. cremoris TaxID=1359 RepID=A0A1V0PAS6_LACLC|nr:MULTISPECIES: hypothetical protein [Lactococcus]ABJ73269.1 hypothetical protein LACR_1775 [Lactococcus cremoris subsp. cremoris SK11]ARE23879.1 hypothetical protein LLJM3_1697 [Lactococcus cremoris]KZK55142.1 hypothetical protein AM2_0118 [Lactococcus cremoris]MCT4409885.1 hypothetical protein [Lactococcus cremoris]MCT4416377.1 hypothetical protein [Lactococcus cremoris]
MNNEPKYNEVKFNEGLIVNGAKIKHLTNVTINSDSNNFSEITVTFMGKIDGLDNLSQIDYSFEENTQESNRNKEPKKAVQLQPFSYKVKGIGSPEILSGIISRQTEQLNRHFR